MIFEASTGTVRLGAHVFRQRFDFLFLLDGLWRLRWMSNHYISDCCHGWLRLFVVNFLRTNWTACARWFIELRVHDKSVTRMPWMVVWRESLGETFRWSSVPRHVLYLLGIFGPWLKSMWDHQVFVSLKCVSRSLATLQTHLADAFDVPCCWLLEDQGANEQNCHEQNFKRFGIVTCPRALGEIPCTVFVPEAFRKRFKLWRAGWRCVAAGL